VATSRLIIPTGIDVGKPVAWMWGDQRLPLTAREANAFSNLESGQPLIGDRTTIEAWLVRMVLLHGSWVSDELGLPNW
jgi:hypothetical protein